MKMNRRKALLGIGSLAVGSGAALGSGAFTSVEADRSVTVDVSSDSAGLVKLSAANDYASETSSGALEIDLSSDNLGADGLNPNATTTLGDTFTVTNNSGSPIYVQIDEVSDSGTTTTVSFLASSSTTSASSNEYIGSSSDNEVEVGPGSSFAVIVEVATGDQQGSQVELTATVSADDESGATNTLTASS